MAKAIIQGIFKETVRIIGLLLCAAVLSLIFFGKRFFENSNYVLHLGYKSTITPKSWYLFIGLFLLITQIFFLLREWYHKFKREMMNIVSLVISLLLLIYLVTAYFILHNMEAGLQRIKQEMGLLNENIIFDNPDPFINLKPLLLVAIMWTAATSVFVFIKSFSAITHVFSVSRD